MSTAVLHALALHVHVLVYVCACARTCVLVYVCVCARLRVPCPSPQPCVAGRTLCSPPHFFAVYVPVLARVCVVPRRRLYGASGIVPYPSPPPLFFVRCVASALNNAVCGQLGLKCLKTFYPWFRGHCRVVVVGEKDDPLPTVPGRIPTGTTVSICRVSP